MNRRYNYIILFVAVVALLWYAERYLDGEEKKSGAPAISAWTHYKEFSSRLLPSSTTGTVVAHRFYTLSYSEAHEQAEWVAYELQQDHLQSRSFDRPYFDPDPKVASGSARWQNYRDSGYDRGHLCPAGDRAFAYEAYAETFLTSNISPQRSGFNGGVWNRLEQKVRYWAATNDGLFVITGGVLGPGLPGIGQEKVTVPEYFFKIILDRSGDTYRAVAFLVPHAATDRPLYDFIVPIVQLERMTGIDFFHNLPEQQQIELEQQTRSYWLEF